MTNGHPIGAFHRRPLSAEPMSWVRESGSRSMLWALKGLMVRLRPEVASGTMPQRGILMASSAIPWAKGQDWSLRDMDGLYGFRVLRAPIGDLRVSQGRRR